MESTAVGSHHQEAAPPVQQPQLPPGFRFHPTDEELVVHYLKRRAQSAPLPVAIIAEIDLYKFDPWELPAKAVFGEQEWYFFSPRERKYPNGARPNRAATSGYWKATGTDKAVLSGGNQKVGLKKALVFYGGKPPRGVKTNWIMHEYRLPDTKPTNKPPGFNYHHHHHPYNKKPSLRLDDWVLCRIYKKSTANKAIDQEREESMAEDTIMGSSMASMSMGLPFPSSINHQQVSKPETLNPNPLLNHHQVIYEGMIDPSVSHLPLKRAMPSSALYIGKGKKPNNHSIEESGGNNNHNNDNSNNNNYVGIASLFNELSTQTTPLQQQPMLGGLQQYSQLPGFNWYS